MNNYQREGISMSLLNNSRRKSSKGSLINYIFVMTATRTVLCRKTKSVWSFAMLFAVNLWITMILRLSWGFVNVKEHGEWGNKNFIHFTKCGWPLRHQPSNKYDINYLRIQKGFLWSLCYYNIDKIRQKIRNFDWIKRFMNNLMIDNRMYNHSQISLINWYNYRLELW